MPWMLGHSTVCLHVSPTLSLTIGEMKHGKEEKHREFQSLVRKAVHSKVSLIKSERRVVGGLTALGKPSHPSWRHWCSL
ncbi:hypothetical protein B0H65DRAFT_450950 [Neurospora tetraspora]|uniref:Uncharacterized protein n=1 Tax=Neurospora tetraspora TaxID=94610 RepID=A0AAE0JP56_9PEZI|nr:hypothetical protein B0H65DRAFT_450950 [Neurospora tetraspora]